MLLCGNLRTRSLSTRDRSQRGRRLPLVGEGLSAPRLENTSPMRHEGTALAPCLPKGTRARQIREASASKRIKTMREPSKHMREGKQAILLGRALRLSRHSWLIGGLGRGT